MPSKTVSNGVLIVTNQNVFDLVVFNDETTPFLRRNTRISENLMSSIVREEPLPWISDSLNQVNLNETNSLPFLI